MKSTVVIPTIGRRTLENAVHSAVREGMDVIVVCDGPLRVPEFPDGVKVVSLGKKFGCYGAMAYNAGAYLAKTKFIVSLADDDELGFGFGEILSKTLEENPEIDIWVPQLNFNDGRVCCCPELGHRLGNICAPIYRVDVLAQVPFRLNMGENVNIIDFYHLEECLEEGFKLDWKLELKYMVRPNLSSRRGMGKCSASDDKITLL